MTKAALALALALAVALVACGDDDTDSAPTSSSNYTVTISAADRFSTGPARFVFLLEDPRGEPVANASVHLRFSFIDPVRDDRKTLKSELSATPVELDQGYDLSRSDGTGVTVGPGPTGIYANNIAFDQAGSWIVDITGTVGNNNLGTIEVPFDVGEVATSPRAGDVAPEVDDGAVVGPAMIVFGEVGVCRSVVCGPLVEVVEEVATAHSDDIDTRYFELEAGAIPAWAEAWNPGAEAAVFFVDSTGIVRGKLQTIATPDEVETLALALLP